jgi:dienelactone hydrolase
MAHASWLRRLAIRAVLLGVLSILGLPPALTAAGETVRFPSLDDHSPLLDGYLFRPEDETPHPALVFLHGCSGLLTNGGKIRAREIAWAERLTPLGYVVLMVDSFTTRNQGEMCSQGGFKLPLYLDRPKDAYGALHYLQGRPFVRPDRIGLIGWSEGGGALLFAIRAASLGRPPRLPSGDFRAAVAFYPSSCREEAHLVAWTSTIPLLVLVGADDNWTPAAPCQRLVQGAVARGAPITLQIYPGAHHDFDWPDLPRREHPAYRMRSGVAPITGTDPAAREDAMKRVPEFLARDLQD